MYLLERQRKILGLLLANEQRMTGSQIAQMIGITDRTVRNDIKDLNEGLKEYPDSYVESIRGKGYLLVSKHKEELLKQVEQSNSNETTKGRLCKRNMFRALIIGLIMVALVFFMATSLTPLITPAVIDAGLAEAGGNYSLFNTGEHVGFLILQVLKAIF